MISSRTKRLPRAERELRTADIGLEAWATTDAPAAKPKRTKPEKPRQRAEAPVPPRRGWARPFAGRAPSLPAVPVHRGSTGQVQGLYPFLYGQSLPPLGVYVGVDCLSGGAFSAHPVEWLRRGITTNPNLLITGNPGVGKSGLLKVLMLRLMASGIRSFVLGDIKNEYAPLARMLGVEPVELGPGLPTRINPLDAGPLGRRLSADPAERRDQLAEIHRRRIALLASLVEIRLERRITPTEEAALSQAIKYASGEADGHTNLKDPTLPEVWHLLRDPAPAVVGEMRMASVEELRDSVRSVADALGNMVQDSLSGLFDGPTTVSLDFDAPIQTIDLSRMKGRGDETIAMLYSSTSSWGQAAIDEPDGPIRIVVRDELWKQMRIAAMVRKVDDDLRLSRSNGTIEVLATHRLSDFEAVGAADSEEVAIARGIVASCDVRVCLAQDTKPLDAIREEIGLTDTEAAQIGGFSAQTKGRALWKIGRDHSHIVQTILSPPEVSLVDTDARMTTRGRTDTTGGGDV